MWRSFRRSPSRTGGDDLIAGRAGALTGEALEFDPSYAVRVISDLVPNPFVGRDIVQSVMDRLRASGFDDAKMGRHASTIIEAMRRALDDARNVQAEALFKSVVQAGRIQFRLRLDGTNWRMPHSVLTSLPEGARLLAGSDGASVGKSLFAPFYEAELNAEERAVAVHLDGASTIAWWHRNVAKVHYGLQGWKRGKVYPDFIFATTGAAGQKRIVALETKGDHLQGPDTAYKSDLLAFLTDSFAWDNTVPVGQVELHSEGVAVQCALVLMQDVRAKLPAIIE